CSVGIMELLDVAKSSVPPSMWTRTPVVLKATAGLRMLPGEKADQLLDKSEGFSSWTLIGSVWLLLCWVASWKRQQQNYVNERGTCEETRNVNRTKKVSVLIPVRAGPLCLLDHVIRIKVLQNPAQNLFIVADPAER
ncbi:hypothetical protein XENOCAPTIV_020312, partial [Xenoophorus captivus]